jgi:DNA-directed RNA polymerase subunit RPC12/RpoP
MQQVYNHRQMAFARCPNCGQQNIRSSTVRGIPERLRSVLGIFPFRCRNCGQRFFAPLWRPSLVRYARCPKCMRTNLSKWSERYYHPPLRVIFKLRMGALPYRCDACRHNFASFRRMLPRPGES